MDLKTKLLDECKRQLAYKVKSLRATIAGINESANVESKSSAGDKHETGRAMMQLEQEKLARQLQELLLQQLDLEKINPHVRTEKIGPGSLIETSNGTFFIATAMGKVQLESKEVLVVSAQSPIGKKFAENQGENFVLNHKIYSIKAVF
jgi:hypothetical protein